MRQLEQFDRGKLWKRQRLPPMAPLVSRGGEQGGHTGSSSPIRDDGDWLSLVSIASEEWSTPKSGWASSSSHSGLALDEPSSEGGAASGDAAAANWVSSSLDAHAANIGEGLFFCLSLFSSHSTGRVGCTFHRVELEPGSLGVRFIHSDVSDCITLSSLSGPKKAGEL